jgi:hypothetical protein
VVFCVSSHEVSVFPLLPLTLRSKDHVIVDCFLHKAMDEPRVRDSGITPDSLPRVARRNHIFVIPEWFSHPGIREVGVANVASNCVIMIVLHEYYSCSTVA